MARILLSRNPASHVDLRDLNEVARLLRVLRNAGDGDAVTALAGRAACHASIYDPSAVSKLLEALSEVGDGDAVAALASRAANAGMFTLYLQFNPDDAPKYIFGREPSGYTSQS